MLKGAMAELGLGNPDRLSVDVGPVISAGAQKSLNEHIERMRKAGHAVHQVALPKETHGTFVPPTLIEIDAVADLPGEVFGPVLHVLRYRREDMEAVVRAVNATVSA
jgi:RHH-type proline utilization regulon transcriptional repressor/proline dehydrogenase/delta 1-pyrroline-5-carboxylate dehydrogenase